MKNKDGKEFYLIENYDKLFGTKYSTNIKRLVPIKTIIYHKITNKKILGVNDYLELNNNDLYKIYIKGTNLKENLLSNKSSFYKNNIIFSKIINGKEYFYTGYYNIKDYDYIYFDIYKLIYEIEKYIELKGHKIHKKKYGRSINIRFPNGERRCERNENTIAYLVEGKIKNNTPYRKLFLDYFGQKEN